MISMIYFLTLVVNKLKTCHSITVFCGRETIEFINSNLPKIEESSVLQSLNLLSNRSSIDIIDFDRKLLRLASAVIARSLTDLYNMSLMTGIVPNDWKFARVTPIYKGNGDINDPGNYYCKLYSLPGNINLLSRPTEMRLADMSTAT